MAENELLYAQDVAPDLIANPDVLGALGEFADHFARWASQVANNNPWDNAIHQPKMFEQLASWTVLALHLANEADIETRPLGNVDEPSEFVSLSRPVIKAVCEAGRREKERRRVRANIEDAEATFASMHVDAAKYTFTDEQLSEVQMTINKLRDQLTELDQIPAQHRKRLLSRLEALQREIHQEMAALDRYMGTILDVAVWAKRIGKEAEPTVKMLGKLWRLGLAAGGAAAGLPPGTIPLALPEADPVDIEDE